MLNFYLFFVLYKFLFRVSVVFVKSSFRNKFHSGNMVPFDDDDIRSSQL